MKYILSLLAIFLLASSSFERRVRRNYKHRSLHTFLGPAQSSVYQFIIGMVKEMTNDPNVTKAIDECSSKIDGAASLQAVQQPDSNENGMTSDSATVTSNFSDIVVKVIDACCTFKDKIVEVLSRRFRRYVRLFMQGKIRVKFLKWGFTGLWDKIKSTADSVATAVVHGAKMVGTAVNHAVDWVNKKIEDFENYVKQKLTETFEPIVNKISDWFKAKFQAWLDKHPVLKQIVNFTVCFIENKGVQAIVKVYHVFKDILSNIAGLFSGKGFITLIINAVCGWRLIKKGFAYLDKASKEKDPLKQAAYRGCATADFLMVAAGESGVDNEVMIQY